MLLLIIQAACSGSFYGGVHLSIPHFNILAVTKTVMDCEKLGAVKFFLSEVFLTQQATDSINDNPEGLSMKIKSLPRSDVLNARQTEQYAGRTDETTLTKHYTTFLIPDGYYAYPIHVWAGSNLTVQINMSYDDGFPPRVLTMFVILGDDNYNAFTINPSSCPHCEYEFDLIGRFRETYNMTLKSNGYYYIVIKVQTDHNITFSAAVNFDYYTISEEDLDFSYPVKLDQVDKEVGMSLHRGNMIVCAVDSAPDGGQYTIHLGMKYSLYSLIVVTIPLSVLLLCILFALILCFVRKSHCHHTRNQYVQLQEEAH